MFNIHKVKIASVMTALLLTGGVLVSAPQRAGAQVASLDPGPGCNVQDTSDNTPDTVSGNADTGNVDQQCGDQNAPDAQSQTADSGAASGSETDNVQQQDGPQNQNDGQPETPDSNAQ
ncbi:MAG: hypothetical protein ACYDBJ_03735 [Aggregatilineales bacterium]